MRRTKANVEDLASFFDARDRVDAVEGWLSERQQALAEQAARRRRAHRVRCGAALRAMRDRGESIREIARMAGISEKVVRELIRDAESLESVAESGEVPVEAQPPEAPSAAPKGVAPNELIADGGHVGGRAGQTVPARA